MSKKRYDYSKITGKGGNNLKLTEKFKFDEEKTLDGSQIETIHIDTSSTDVTIKPSTNDQVIVHYYGHGNDKGIEGNDFTIQQQASALSIMIKQIPMIRFGIVFIDAHLDVLLPPKLFKQLHMKTSSGDIHLNQINCEQVKLEATSGEIEAIHINSNRLSINTTSGDIDLQEGKSKQLSLRTTSGEISVENVFSQDLSAQSTSGDIELNHFIGENITLKATSGEIKGTYIIGNVQANTSSGDVDFYFKEISPQTFIHTSSGDVTVRTEQNPSIRLSFSTSSGEFTDENGNTFEQKKFQKVYGRGEQSLSVKTSSGDFEFDM